MMEEAATTVPTYTPPTAVITAPVRILPGITMLSLLPDITCRRRVTTRRCRIIARRLLVGGAGGRRAGVVGVQARAPAGVGQARVAVTTGRHRATGEVDMGVTTVAIAGIAVMVGGVAAGMVPGGARD